MELPNIIDNRLKSLGKTRYRLAKECDFDPSIIYSTMKNGSPNFKTLKQIFDALGGKLVVKFEHEEFEL